MNKQSQYTNIDENNHKIKQQISEHETMIEDLECHISSSDENDISENEKDDIDSLDSQSCSDAPQVDINLFMVDCGTQTDEVYIIETTSKGRKTTANFENILNGALNLVNMIVSAKDNNEDERNIMIREHGKMLEHRVKKNNEEMKHIMLKTYHDLGEVFSKSMTSLENTYEETIFRV